MKSALIKQMGIWRPVRSTTLWTVAVAFSLALNLVFFDLMPRLIAGDTGKLEYSQYIEEVEVIRIKRPEEPARRKEKKEKPKPRETPKKLLQKKQVYANRPVKHTVDLPFEINPKLPAISGAVAVPAMQTVLLGAPDLKGSYGIGEIDYPLTPLVQVPPMYPMRARRRGIEGWVKVRFIVNGEGRVDDIRVLESHPRKIFDRPVIRCVSAWRFTPGTVEGMPVNTWVETTIRFDLE